MAALHQPTNLQYYDLLELLTRVSQMVYIWVQICSLDFQIYTGSSPQDMDMLVVATGTKIFQ